MRLSDLEKYHSITIQCHDNPDADAIGAGYGLYRYFCDKGCDVRLIYSGHNEIKKANLKLMIDELHIPIEHVSPCEKRIIEGLLLTVDCQYGAGNVTRLNAENVAVIDHHPLEVLDVELVRVQANLGSCATLVWSMLKEEGYSVSEDIKLGTALYYGLYTDTNQFSEVFHPLDMDMREDVKVNKRLMVKLRNSNISLKELEIAGVAMLRYNYNEEHRFAVIKTQPCDPNIVGVISDFLLQVDVIDTCVVYNEMHDGYKISVRSCIKEADASELASYLTKDIGSGGGHFEKAGGFISRKLYEERYPRLHTEAYFISRMSEYFATFRILSAKNMQLDLSEMKMYRRRKNKFCYVKAADLVKPGSNISVRTAQGAMDKIVDVDTYITIEKDGLTRFLTEERFQKHIQPIDEKVTSRYCRDIEDVYTIKDWEEDKIYKVEDYGHLCVAKEEFCIYATELNDCVKLFTKWDEDKYLLGMPGDYLAVSVDDLSNVFIEPGYNFRDRYEEI